MFQIIISTFQTDIFSVVNRAGGQDLEFYIKVGIYKCYVTCRLGLILTLHNLISILCKVS